MVSLDDHAHSPGPEDAVHPVFPGDNLAAKVTRRLDHWPRNSRYRIFLSHQAPDRPERVPQTEDVRGVGSKILAGPLRDEARAAMAN